MFKEIFKLTSLQKRNSVGYERRKSKVVSRLEINTFLANVTSYVLIKVRL